MKSQWKVCRQVKEKPDGQRRWDRAYQLLLQWTQSVDLAKVLRQSDLPEWQQQALLEADQGETGYGSRYTEVPRADSHEGYQDIEDFILTARDERLQERLWHAIRGRGACRRLKDVLAYHPRERERWFEFQEGQLRGRVLDWLESEGIQPILSPAPGEDDRSASSLALPSRRNRRLRPPPEMED